MFSTFLVGECAPKVWCCCNVGMVYSTCLPTRYSVCNVWYPFAYKFRVVVYRCVFVSAIYVAALAIALWCTLANKRYCSINIRGKYYVWFCLMAKYRLLYCYQVLVSMLHSVVRSKIQWFLVGHMKGYHLPYPYRELNKIRTNEKIEINKIKKKLHTSSYISCFGSISSQYSIGWQPELKRKMYYY